MDARSNTGLQFCPSLGPEHRFFLGLPDLPGFVYFPTSPSQRTNKLPVISRLALVRKHSEFHVACPRCVWRLEILAAAKLMRMSQPPDAAFTSLRAVVDPVAEPSIRALLPAHLHTPVHGASHPPVSPAELEQLLQHPLAAHVPLWVAHVHRLVAAAAELHQVYAEAWRAHAPPLTVERVLQSDAVAELERQVQARQPGSSLRASLRATRDGGLTLSSAPLASPAAVPLCVRLDVQSTELDEPLAHLKTTSRAAYDQARERTQATLGVASDIRDPCFDVLLWHNTQDGAQLLTESSIANLVVELPASQGLASKFVTPPFKRLLPGVLVQELVRRGIVEQAPITVAQLRAWLEQQSARLWLCNAVRGMFEVQLVP